MCPFMPLRIDSVLSKLARARGGVRPHRGFTVKFTAPGAPHLGHHHLPPIPRCRHHAPGAYRPRLPTYLRTPRAVVVYTYRCDGTYAYKHASDLPPPRRPTSCAPSHGIAPAHPCVQDRAGGWPIRVCKSRAPLRLALAPGGFHGSRPGPRCAAPGASRARARPHMWGSQ